RLKSLMNRLPCRPLLYRATAGRILFVSFVFTRRMVARRKIRLAEFGSALVGVPVPNTLDERGPRPSVRESEGTVVAPRVARLPQDRSCGLRVVPVPLDIRVVPVFEYRRDRVFALYGGSAIQKRLDEALLVDGLRQRHPELFVADERDREHEFGIERREVLRGHLRDGVGLTRTGGLR